MKRRASILVVLLGAALLLFQQGESRGWFHEAEQGFLDFLVANAPDAFVNHAPAFSKDVVIVQFREEDKNELSAWPPAPLDYLMVLKRVMKHNPEVVIFSAPMRWKEEQPQFISQLRDQLVRVPSVIYSFQLSATANQADQDETDFFTHHLPVFDVSETNEGATQHFAAVTGLPNKALRPSAHFGFNMTTLKDSVPLVATDHHRLTPSLAAQAITLYRHTPYAEQRLRFGIGGRLNLGERFIVPLDLAGAFHLRDSFEIPTFNALDLMVPEIGDDPKAQLNEILGSGKVIFFIIPTAPGSDAQARALAQGLALPEAKRLGNVMSWSLAALAFLFALRQMTLRSWSMIVASFVFVALLLAASLLTFQTALIWWSPFAALIIVILSTAFCCLFPVKRDLPSA